MEKTIEQAGIPIPEPHEDTTLVMMAWFSLGLLVFLLAIYVLDRCIAAVYGDPVARAASLSTSSTCSPIVTSSTSSPTPTSSTSSPRDTSALPKKSE